MKLIGWRLLLQGQALSQLKTLPQILLPTRFSLIKALVRHGRGLQVPPRHPPPSPRACARAQKPLFSHLFMTSLLMATASGNDNQGSHRVAARVHRPDICKQLSALAAGRPSLQVSCCISVSMQFICPEP